MQKTDGGIAVTADGEIVAAGDDMWDEKRSIVNAAAAAAAAAVASAAGDAAAAPAAAGDSDDEIGPMPVPRAATAAVDKRAYG